MTDNKKTISINSRAQWRQWLEKNHQIEQSVWVLCNTQKSGLPAVPWSDMVDEALCFGWIDSTRRSVDANSFVQLYSRRKAKSTWSKINKEKIDRLEMEGLMSEAGWAAVHRAKNDGSWNILDTVEALSIPTDLELEFKKHRGAKKYFESLSKSLQKQMLHWIIMARRPETRKVRIDQVAEHIGRQTIPPRFIV